ncbi:hypothetical protein ACIBCT_05510 [Streptosporangium sp. NPDC050855]|uniref:hypothetical protein n=1 Tax=Streptosporangium sp. NPDC050855 TaxID=3366194 RepID=UPI0037AF56D9
MQNTGKVRWAAASVATVAALAGSLTMTASASAEAAVTPAARTAVALQAKVSAVPCGLTHSTGDLPGGPLKIVYYTIRNCHSYTVQRKLEIAGTTDGSCHTIPGGRTVSSSRVIAGWASVRGMKAC